MNRSSLYVANRAMMRKTGISSTTRVDRGKQGRDPPPSGRWRAAPGYPNSQSALRLLLACARQPATCLTHQSGAHKRREYLRQKTPFAAAGGFAQF
jgi:hypothetical protein